jgi:hypothetical protein
MLQGAAEGRRAGREGTIEMSKRKGQGVEVEMGTGNVYADLGYGDADGGPGTLNTSSSGLTKSAAKLPLSDSPE